MAISICTSARGAARLSGVPLPLVGKSNWSPSMPYSSMSTCALGGQRPVDGALALGQAEQAEAEVGAEVQADLQHEPGGLGVRRRLVGGHLGVGGVVGGPSPGSAAASGWAPRRGAVTVTPSRSSASMNAVRMKAFGSSTRKVPTNDPALGERRLVVGGDLALTPCPCSRRCRRTRSRPSSERVTSTARRRRPTVVRHLVVDREGRGLGPVRELGRARRPRSA